MEIPIIAKKNRRETNLSHPYCMLGKLQISLADEKGMEFEPEIPAVCCMLSNPQISLADLERCCLGLGRRRGHGAAPRLIVVVILLLRRNPCGPLLVLCCQMRASGRLGCASMRND